MKTKHDSAIDYCFEIDGQFTDMSYDAFIAGVEFAQRWIPIEQLPEIKEKSYQILVKTTPTPSGTIMHRVIAIFFFESQRAIEMKLSKYTHWRAINIE